MMNNCFKKYLLLITIFLCNPNGIIYAVSVNITSMERIIKENQHFIDFIDSCISNYGSNEIIISYKEANEFNYKAKIALLQADYSKSLRLIKSSQEILRDIYYEMLSDVYRKNTELLLNIAAPLIIRTKDRKAEYLLKKGYQALKIAEKYKKIGYNWNRFLFSGKIKYYLDGIKSARQSRKYAFLAIIESKTPIEEKSDYKLQTFDEALNPEAQEDKEIISDYKKIGNQLRTYINKNLISRDLAKKFKFFLHHDDNYGQISSEKKSIKFDFLKNLGKFGQGFDSQILAPPNENEARQKNEEKNTKR